ncbi:MAG: hypothetical protein GVY12_10675 [Bacteroidetes bacterium]|jgi:hypothetical protein|nr:hypothetical protein [Bacteroidota bacterium]
MRFCILWAVLISTVLLFPSNAEAQTDVTTGPPTVARNLIHGEVLGAGGLYSLNYERRFARRWALRVGFSAYSGEPEAFEDDYVTLVLVPVMVNALLPGGTHNLELGAGPVLGYAGARSQDYGSLNGVGIGNFSANIAYRYQPTSGGFSFRAGILPNYSGDTVLIWPSLSMGYTF